MTTSPRAPQSGRRRLRDEEAALHRRAERAVEVGLRDLLEALRLESRRGAVDDDVESAELCLRPGDERTGVVGPGEVAVAAAGGEHLPPLATQPVCDRGAELARAAGDERACQLACSNRFATSSQLTTFHHAAR